MNEIESPREREIDTEHETQWMQKKYIESVFLHLISTIYKIFVFFYLQYVSLAPSKSNKPAHLNVNERKKRACVAIHFIHFRFGPNIHIHYLSRSLSFSDAFVVHPEKFCRVQQNLSKQRHTALVTFVFFIDNCEITLKKK